MDTTTDKREAALAAEIIKNAGLTASKPYTEPRTEEEAAAQILAVAGISRK
ncbi:MAG: hypothetical protein PHG21_03775 [Azoarcus sp.]|nr:hypothetical protein [Azoarcus sp.]